MVLLFRHAMLWTSSPWLNGMNRAERFSANHRQEILRLLVRRMVCRRVACWAKARQEQFLPTRTPWLMGSEGAGPEETLLPIATAASEGRGSRLSFSSRLVCWYSCPLVPLFSVGCSFRRSPLSTFQLCYRRVGHDREPTTSSSVRIRELVSMSVIPTRELFCLGKFQVRGQTRSWFSTLMDQRHS